MSNDWTYWRKALNGEFIDFDIHDVPTGYYRHKNGYAVAFWRDDDGTLHCNTTAQKWKPRTRDQICEYFAYCSRQPITHELYNHIVGGGDWPETVRPAEPESEAADERIKAQIAGLSVQFQEWIKQIGGKVAEQEHADKAANYADQFAKLEKEAVALHKAEKEPHLEAGRAVDGKWKPIIGDADGWKRSAKKSTESFLIEQDRKRREAEAKQREAERQAALKNQPPPAAPLPDTIPRTTAGTGRKTALRTVKVVQITDIRALAAYLATVNDNPDFIAVCERLARRLLEAGVEIPGAELREEKRAA